MPYFISCQANSFRDVAHGVGTAAQGIGGQLSEGRRRDREGASSRRRCSVDQETEDREAANPVGERVLHEEDDGDSTVCQPGNHRGVPQWSVHRQPTHDESTRDF
jgi:hypothetical protein